MLTRKLSILLAIVCIINLGIFNIPFQGDEVLGLLSNRVVRDLGEFWERMISLKGLFQRPLSVLSFALNYRLSAGATWSYHALNLLIHLVNIVLIYNIGKQLKISAIFAAAIFATHPLATACVGQIYGRSYSLGTMFMSLALYQIVSRKNNKWGVLDRLIQVSLWIGMLFSKQVFVFYPIVALTFYSAIYRGRQSERTKHNILWVYLSVLFAALVFVGIFAVHVLGNIENAPVSSSVYFFSQMGNLPSILFSFYLMPYNTALFHELPWYEHYLDGFLPLTGTALLVLISYCWLVSTKIDFWNTSSLLFNCLFAD